MEAIYTIEIDHHIILRYKDRDTLLLLAISTIVFINIVDKVAEIPDLRKAIQINVVNVNEHAVVTSIQNCVPLSDFYSLRLCITWVKEYFYYLD